MLVKSAEYNNEKDIVEDIQYLCGLSLSDHVCLEYAQADYASII